MALLVADGRRPSRSTRLRPRGAPRRGTPRRRRGLREPPCTTAGRSDRLAAVRVAHVVCRASWRGPSSRTAWLASTAAVSAASIAICRRRGAARACCLQRRAACRGRGSRRPAARARRRLGVRAGPSRTRALPPPNAPHRCARPSQALRAAFQERPSSRRPSGCRAFARTSAWRSSREHGIGGEPEGHEQRPCLAAEQRPPGGSARPRRSPAAARLSASVRKAASARSIEVSA